MNKIRFAVYKTCIVSFSLMLCFICGIHVLATTEQVDSSQSEIDKQILEKGDKLTYVFSISEYEGKEEGINAIKGTLDYDENVFGELDQDDFKVLNGWEEFLYNPQTKEFVAIKQTPNKEAESVFSLELEVKQNVEGTTTYVGVKQIEVSQGKEDLTPADSSAKVEIVAESQEGSSGQGNQSGTTTDGEHGGSSGTTTDEHTSGNNTSDKIQITLDKETGVHTGDSSLTNLYVLACFVAVLLAIVVVMKQRLNTLGYVFASDGKVRKASRFAKCFAKKNKTVLLVLLAVACSVTAISQVYANSKKGELNNDGDVTLADVILLEKHLISLEKLNEKQQKLADMNNDGKLTVTDLSLLLRKAIIQYDATITSAMNNVYFEKNEEIQLQFAATVKDKRTAEEYTSKIEKVAVEGIKDPVEVTLADGVYTLILPKETNAGIKEYTITDVFLENGKKATVNNKQNFTQKVDVLKDDIRVENYTIEEDTKKAELKVSFDVVDPDNALENACIHIMKAASDEAEEEELDSKTVVVGKNEFSFALKDNEDYIAYFELNYRTDHKLDEEEDEYVKSMKFNKPLALNIDYQFKFEGLAIYANDMKEITDIAKNESYRIGFKASNVTEYPVVNAVINGTSYDVKEENGVYYVEMPASTQSKTESFTVESLTLSNGKKFTLDKDNKVELHVLKEKASISDMQVNEGKNSLDISFKVQDNDKTLSNTKVVVKDADGKEIFTQEVKDTDVKVSVDTSTIYTTSYTVEVIADSNLGGSEDLNETGKVLSTQTKEANVRVDIENATVSEAYVEKGSSVELTYQIKTNIKEELTKLVVNNEILNVTKDKDVYKVTYKVSENAGVQELSLMQVMFGDKKVDVNHKQSVEVFKSKPTLTDYEAVDAYEQKQVTVNFTIEDLDQAFVSGKVQVLDKDKKVVKEETITKAGKQNIVIDVTPKEVYSVKVFITYDRSSDEKHRVTDEEVLEKPLQLIDNYEVKIDSIKTYAGNTETTSFEKGNDIKVTMNATTVSIYDFTSIVVNGTSYELEKDGSHAYTFIIKGLDTAGEKAFTIEKATFANGKEITLENRASFNVDILKDKPTVEQYVGGKNINDLLEATFTIKDEDKAIISIESKIVDGNGTVLQTSNQASGEVKLETALSDSEQYNVVVTATYARDKDKAKEEKDVVLLNESLTASKDAIYLKEITDTTLYTTADGTSKPVTILDITNGMPDVKDYYVKVTMKSSPDFYSKVKEFRKNTTYDVLDVVLEQSELMQRLDDGKRKNEFSFIIPYIDASGEHHKIKKANEFFNKIASDLKGTYELTEDLDASNISQDKAAIIGTFTGTLKGNGYKIYNLNTAMFDVVNNAKIENVIFENANITAVNAKGVLANTIKGTSTINQVYVVDSTILNKHSQVGGITGLLTGSAAINESAAININFRANDTIGGITGQSDANTVIKNSYVTGTVQADQSGNANGARAAGISGWHNGTIENCFTKVNIISHDKKGNGGLIGGPSDPTKATTKIKNSLAITSGTAYRIAGFDTLGSSSNVYEYSDSNAVTNINDGNKDKVFSVDNLTDVNFFKSTLGFDESIWNLDLISAGKLPVLKNDPLPNDLKGYETVDNAHGIENYTDIRANKNYSSEKEIAYYNMSKLMPFADTDAWVEQGNKVDANSKYAQKKIRYVFPLDSKNNLIVGLTKDTVEKVTKVRILFEDDSRVDQTIQYKKTLGNIVAVYEVDNQMIYQFPKYIANIDTTWLQDVIDKANTFTFDDIEKVTAETETRVYREYYTEKVKPRVSDILTSLIISQDAYPTYLDNAVVSSEWQSTITKDESLKSILYAYNYYDKWYRINFDGLNLSDVMFYSGTILSKDMKAPQLVSELMSTDESKRKTSATDVYYNTFVKKYTGKSLLDFLGYFAQYFAGFETPSDWFANEFDGLLVEGGLENNANMNVNYRVWDLMKNIPKPQLFLPLLTGPQEDMYILCVPSQFLFGSINAYGNTDQEDVRSKVYNTMQDYAKRFSKFYGSIAALTPNAEKFLNSNTHLGLDTREGFVADIPSKGIYKGVQKDGVTNDPVLKWIGEASGLVSPIKGNGVAALAGNGYTYWIATRQLDGSDFAYGVFTHEIAHSQDGSFFYGGYGRRPDTDMETHADGVWRQRLADREMVFNFTYDIDPSNDLAKNFSYSRVNSPESFESYYKGMFETGYVLDYLAAQAFFQLTPEQQAAVAAQVSENVVFTSTKTGQTSTESTFSRISAEQFANMKLDSMEDLWDNKIIWTYNKLNSPLKIPSAKNGQYSEGNFYDMMWYQPHNDNGTPDNVSFKRLGQEMAGYAGYVNGFLKYISSYAKYADGIENLTDLTVLQSITNDPNMTWKQYKMNRYENVKQNLANVSFFDTNKVIEEFKKAFETDAATPNAKSSQVENVKRLYYGIVKRATNDFSTGSVYDKDNVVMIHSAQELITAISNDTMGYYRLANDIDFNGISASDGYYMNKKFMGTLDGNGYTLRNVNYTLFKELRYASVKNVNIESPVYLEGSTAYIANVANQAVLESIHVKNSDTILPMVVTKTNACFEHDLTSDSIVTTISSVDDFLKIGESSVNLAKRYELTTDLDFTGKDYSSLIYVINGTFKGQLNGNNHTIKGLNGTLFKTLDSATITNLVIEGSKLTHEKQRGTIAFNAVNTIVTNVKVKDAYMHLPTGQTSATNIGEIGGLIGNVKGGSFTNIFVENIDLRADHVHGGIAGVIDGTTITNAVVTGKIHGTRLHPSQGARVAGIVGVAKNTTIENVFTNIALSCDYPGSYDLGTGGLIGGPSSTNVSIKNSVSAVATKDGYRISGGDAATILANSSNVYELASSSLKTNITDANADRIKSVEEATLKTKEFYVTNLGWSEEVWDFTNIETTGVPTLRLN